MTDNELRRLSRAELLEILIRLTNENEELKRNLNDAEGKLNDRKIMIGESGSIAEAALKLSDVFSAAESAAKLYLENSERLCGEKTAGAEAYSEKTRREADDYSAKVREEADAYSHQTRGDADETAAKTREDADTYSVRRRTDISRSRVRRRALTGTTSSRRRRCS